MKKFIKLSCILLALAFLLAGCSLNKKTSYDKTQVQRAFSNAVMQQIKVVQNGNFDPRKIAIREDVKDKALQSWKENRETAGQIIGVKGPVKFSVANGEIVAKQEFVGKNRNIVATATYFYDAENKNKLTLYDLSFEPVYSTNEKLQSAASNTVLGMGTVFVVLIFISLIISSFNLIPVFKDKFGKKKKTTNFIKEKKDKEHRNKKKDKTKDTDDSELVAVISAAIAATENVATDSFVVRSIRKR